MSQYDDIRQLVDDAESKHVDLHRELEAERGKVELLTEKLEEAANAKAEELSGSTPLIVAVQSLLALTGDARTMENYLLSRGWLRHESGTWINPATRALSFGQLQGHVVTQAKRDAEPFKALIK